MTFEEYREHYFKRWQKRIARQCRTLFFFELITTLLLTVILYVAKSFSLEEFVSHMIIRVGLPAVLNIVILVLFDILLKKTNCNYIQKCRFVIFEMFWLLSILAFSQSKYQLCLLFPSLTMFISASVADLKLLKRLYQASYTILVPSLAFWYYLYGKGDLSTMFVLSITMAISITVIYIVSKQILNTHKAQIDFINFGYSKQVVLTEELQLEPLTRLYNRRALAETVEKLMKSLESSEDPYDQAAMIFFDLDNFKIVNDKFGHAAGDAILMSLSESIVKIMKTNRNAFRYGGDEFVLLMRQKNLAEVICIVNQIINEFRRNSFDYLPEGNHCSMSVGISFYKKGWTSKDWFKSADEAAYKAKINGKDRYEIAD